MKPLEARFNNIQKENPCWSSYVCFAETIIGQDYSRNVMAKYFNKLVDKDDYARSDRMTSMDNLMELTNRAGERKKQGI